ncbi:hypothetical protein QO200_06400 [Flavobacterium sp. Arc3]|uniref:hypothetical protein n=1 Tax=Flavobacterium sp. Arc3 TaxID=3046686 RepID=UPI00352FA7B2
MGSTIKIALLVLISCSLSFCASKQDNQMKFPQEIVAAYYQKTNSVEGQVPNGIDFYIEFNIPLQEGIILDKVYFKNQEAKLEKEDKYTFKAHFNQFPASYDLVLDSDPLKEYGNKAHSITQPKFELQSTEAVLEYSKNDKTFFYKIKAIKERPMIPNPSGIKPKK